MPSKLPTSQENGPDEGPIGAPSDDLTYREAQTALELAIAQLQEADLDVEAMSDLYQRAMAYADRCEGLLERLEQEVLKWDPQDPDQAPAPFSS